MGGKGHPRRRRRRRRSLTAAGELGRRAGRRPRRRRAASGGRAGCAARCSSSRWTDAPGRRFAAGTALRTEPAGRRSADGASTVRSAGGRLVVHFAGYDDRPAAEALRGVQLFVPAADRPRARGSRRVLRHRLVGLAAPSRRRRRARAGRRRRRTAGARLPRARDRRAASGWCRSSPRSCRRSTCRAAGSSSTRRTGCSSCERRHAHAHRRRHDLPRLPRPAAAVAAGQGGRARARSTLRVHDLRAWTDDVHRTVDDTPYGGGPGMVMRPEPWGRALDDRRPGRRPAQPRLIVPTPAGRPFTQAFAAELAAEPWLVFACGRYEGIDARVRRVRGAADAGGRGQPRRLRAGRRRGGGAGDGRGGGPAAARRARQRRVAVDDSFGAGPAGLLEAPAYTKPARWRGLDVPDVLLSGTTARSPAGAPNARANAPRGTGPSCSSAAAEAGAPGHG